MDENKNLEKIQYRNAEKVSGGFSKKFKDKSGKFKVGFKDRLLGYKSKDIYCDFCGKKFTAEGVLDVQGKHACIKCYSELPRGILPFTDDKILN